MPPVGGTGPAGGRPGAPRAAVGVGVSAGTRVADGEGRGPLLRLGPARGSGTGTVRGLR